MNERDKWINDTYGRNISWHDHLANERHEQQISRVYDECIPQTKKPTMLKVPKTKKIPSWEDSDEAMLLIG